VAVVKEDMKVNLADRKRYISKFLAIPYNLVLGISRGFIITLPNRVPTGNDDDIFTLPIRSQPRSLCRTGGVLFWYVYACSNGICVARTPNRAGLAGLRRWTCRTSIFGWILEFQTTRVDTRFIWLLFRLAAEPLLVLFLLAKVTPIRELT